MIISQAVLTSIPSWAPLSGLVNQLWAAIVFRWAYSDERQVWRSCVSNTQV